MHELEEFIYLRTYSRFIESEGRRETWTETVDRFCDYLFSRSFNSEAIPEKVKRKIREYLTAREVLPSMRFLWSAGSACDSLNQAIYNCSALVIDNQIAFGEILLNLMAGSGVGFSVERQYVDKLPIIKHQRNTSVSSMIIPDSRFGWQEALNAGISLWLEGRDIVFDYNKIRPLGTPLRTMGGRASGPQVLHDLLNTARATILGAQGRKLTPLECHDLCCAIARCVIAGGVRRSAMISLSDLDDREMRYAKRPPFDPIRFGANNSAVYHDHPDDLEFMREFVALGRSGTGERGIFNLWGAKRNAPKRRLKRPLAICNPCGEVTLRSKEFCNLSTFVVRPDDAFEDLQDKVITATWIGVIQSTFTNFPGLSPEWAQNCEEERLIGVSPTGILDNPVMLDSKSWDLLKQTALSTARKASKILNIGVPAAATCIKPSGTVSSLVGSSSGIHPRWAPFYINNIQIASTDPLCRLLIDQGAPMRPDPNLKDTMIVSFPIAAPRGAVTRRDLTALDQLEIYKTLTTNWCEMNCSATIYVGQKEWLHVADWVYHNWEQVNGLSFFPKEGNHYAWAPLEEIDEETYVKLIKEFPAIDYGQLPDYERGDQTTGAKEFACAGGGCDA